MAAISCACIRDLLIWGSAMERIMRMIAITINSSMSEKPCWFRRLSRFKDDIRFTSYDVATGVSVVSVGVLFCRFRVGRKGLEPLECRFEVCFGVPKMVSRGTLYKPASGLASSLLALES